MGLKWKCIEPLTAIGCGWGAYAVGVLDGGLTAGAIVGGSALMRIWAEAKQKVGLDSEKVTKRQRKRIMAVWDARAGEDWLIEADLLAADERLAEHLAEAIPSHKELGLSIRDGKAYPAHAARMIVDRLAARPDCRIFSQEGEAGASVTARTFALEVVEASLEAALEIPEYAQKLHTWFFVAINEGIGEANKKLDRLEARVDEVLRLLQTSLGQLAIPDPVLRETIVYELSARPGSSDAELADAIRQFKAKHDRLRAQVGRIEAFDNEIASIKAEAAEALQAFDHGKAAGLYAEARKKIDALSAERAKQGAEFAKAEAEALILENDWRSATAVWKDAAAKLKPYDVAASVNLLNESANRLRHLNFRFGKPPTLTAQAMCRDLLEEFEMRMNARGKAIVRETLARALLDGSETVASQAELNSLEEAAELFEQVANYWREESTPKFADMKEAQGSCLGKVGRAAHVTRSADALSKAEACFDDALRAGSDAGWDAVRLSSLEHNLGNILHFRGEWAVTRQASRAFFAQSADHYLKAIEAREESPWLLARSQAALGACYNASSRYCDQDEAREKLELAIKSFDSALAILDEREHPMDSATNYAGRGDSRLMLAPLLAPQQKTAAFEKAVEDLKQCVALRQRRASPLAWARACGLLARAYSMLGSDTPPGPKRRDYFLQSMENFRNQAQEEKIHATEIRWKAICSLQAQTEVDASLADEPIDLPMLKGALRDMTSLRAFFTEAGSEHEVAALDVSMGMANLGLYESVDDNVLPFLTDSIASLERGLGTLDPDRQNPLYSAHWSILEASRAHQSEREGQD